LILACARDGKRERVIPWSGGLAAHAGYLFPWGKDLLKPILQRMGRRHKRQLLQRKGPSRTHAGTASTRAR
jgi:hypothetical protein